MPVLMFAASSDEDDDAVPRPTPSLTEQHIIGAPQPNEISRKHTTCASQPAEIPVMQCVRSHRSRSRRVTTQRGERTQQWPGTAYPVASFDLEPHPSHWAEFINMQCTKWRAPLGRQLRKLLTVTAYTGTNPSKEVLREITVSDRDLIACDPKPCARLFRERNGLESSCSFGDIRELNETGTGWC